MFTVQILKKKNLNFYPKLIFDKSKPNGTIRKVLNVSLAKKFGWVAKTDLKTGTNLTIKSFLNKKY